MQWLRGTVQLLQRSAAQYCAQCEHRLTVVDLSHLRF